jgi:hypothetical protein
MRVYERHADTGGGAPPDVDGVPLAASFAKASDVVALPDGRMLDELWAGLKA